EPSPQVGLFEGPISPLGTDPSTSPDSLFPLTCSSQAHLPESVWEFVVWTAVLSEGSTEGAVELAVEVEFHSEEEWQSGEELESFAALIEGRVDSEEIRLEGDGFQLELDRPEDSDTGFWSGTITREDLQLRMSCWQEDFAPRFRYEQDSGQCLDSKGSTGRQSLPVEYVRATGDGNCVDLGEQRLEEENFSYPLWDGFDLRGADLSRAHMNFAEILDASFEGARLNGFDFGYVWLSGSVDSFTELPDFCDAPVDGSWFECVQ
ncbi:MAG: pentapeptide repeat-containing protein, partial [Myxococcota bacterium]|nr:pentapeptide repeat-containing protein [Myxococcota bacterium]